QRSKGFSSRILGQFTGSSRTLWRRLRDRRRRRQLRRRHHDIDSYDRAQRGRRDHEFEEGAVTAPELAIGQIVAGKYSIQSLLHHGGVTAPYHAVTAPNRDVALKLYDPKIKSFPDVMRELARVETIVKTLPAHLVMHVLERGEDPSTKAPYTVTDLCAN